MLDDIKKSFTSVLHERTTSPFYGTLICAWVIWNWKIFYLTFFISADTIQMDKIPINKIDYIMSNYSDSWHIVWFPLLSTIVLLTLIPFVSNGAYWLSIIFTKWKIDKKNAVDRLQLLSLEQSIELREKISKQSETFGKMLEEKSLEIKQLNVLFDEYKKNQTNKAIKNDDKNTDTRVIDNEVYTVVKDEKNEAELEENEFQLIDYKIKSEKWLHNFDNIINCIREGQNMLNDKIFIPHEFISLLEAYDIIEVKDKGIYKFTEKGKRFRKSLIKNEVTSKW